tara:strand:+ start:65 stop:481 length:417 start_codon:yes stop_codon:yes gene_type:complete
VKHITSLITILFISLLSSPSWSETLILKCDSRKSYDDDWIGNTVFWKINLKTKSVLMKEINDSTVVGWIVHKLTSETDDYLIIKQCITSDCNMDEDSGDSKTYTQVDRTTGILKKLAVINETLVTSFEYQCDKTDRLF